jgi:hypothetical protein
MDQETITNHIKNLSKAKFDALAGLVLRNCFNFTPINVDGSGDGGSDIRLFTDQANNRTARSIALQMTVQESAWKNKAFADAEKSKNKLGASRYFFLSSRAHQQTSLREVENRIATELGVQATCLGAKELAGFVLEKNLLREFAHAIGLPLEIQTRKRPDRSEVLLHAYISLGADRHDLRDEIYDDSIQIALFDAGEPLTKDQLVEQAAALFGSHEALKDRLYRRLDSLLAKMILTSQDGKLILSDIATETLSISSGVYSNELESLSAAQAQILEDHCNVHWGQAQCVEAATLLCRMFMQEQLLSAEHASVSLSRLGLSRILGNPEEQLRKAILSSGAKPGNVNKVLEEFVEHASNTPLVQKLTRAVTFVATEGQDVLKASKVLGAASWSDVVATLDASVAIPFLCSSLFSVTKGGFSFASTRCVHTLVKAGTRLVIPGVYINEIASHLYRAGQYPESDVFKDGLVASTNGFVAHYFQLREEGGNVPDTLREFLAQFASVTKSQKPQDQLKRAVMAQVQPLLAEYGVIADDISNVSEDFLREVQEAYAYKTEEMHKNRAQILVRHDALVLANARQAIAERGEVRMCLTWDSLMIAVARSLENCGWVVSPHQAADIVGDGLSISEARLTALAHHLARARQTPSDLGARIIDRVVSLGGEKLQDWEFRRKLEEFYTDARNRIDLDGNAFQLADKQTNEFLEAQGVVVSGVVDDAV